MATAHANPLWYYLRRYAGRAAPLPADLLGAIVARLRGDGVIAGACGARVWTGEVPPRGTIDPATGRMGPFVVATEVYSIPDFTITDNYLDDVTVQISVFAADSDLARSLGKRARAVLSPARGYTPLQFADGKEVVPLPGRSRLFKESGQGSGNAYVWHQMNEYRYIVGRTLALP